MNKIIVITGPTGVGKTKLSISLAKKYNAEIINADSVQVYKYLNIGSAKVTEDEKEGITHHLLDFKNLDEEYSVYDYQKGCREKIKEITKKGKNVIIVGGTGLYIKAALYNYEFNEEENNYETYDKYTNDELYEMLLKKDRDTKIHKNNRQRVIRFLNKQDTSKTLSNELLYDVVFIGLTTDRRLLYEKINLRVDQMISEGLISEVTNLYNKYPNSKILKSAIGYREIVEYIDGNCTLEEAVEKIKQDSRRYAKRQYTWFNNQMDIEWFNVNYNDFNETIKNVENYIEQL